MVQNLFTISIVFARFICNHYTAKGQEKDSAFSYPKPQLLLTKPKQSALEPKRFIPLQDKNLLEVDNYLPACETVQQRKLRQNKKPNRHTTLSRGLTVGFFELFVTKIL